ncbi:hypothetical protein CJ030_MR3G026356 [Morella rubra]|uniref:Uncharacterized protein n=1 Tax=Morella rubra TaxID=262757 RepID=A0A6A1W2B7_9ROSI|nr:hypothetical protein CJ030_MR3G026356 [Morella rubra]
MKKASPNLFSSPFINNGDTGAEVKATEGKAVDGDTTGGCPISGPLGSRNILVTQEPTHGASQGPSVEVESTRKGEGLMRQPIIHRRARASVERSGLVIGVESTKKRGLEVCEEHTESKRLFLDLESPAPNQDVNLFSPLKTFCAKPVAAKHKGVRKASLRRKLQQGGGDFTNASGREAFVPLGRNVGSQEDVNATGGVAGLNVPPTPP